VGILLDYLETRFDLWENTIVIVAADHGEEFKEHGMTKHNQQLYDESIHVPLIVHIPGFEPDSIQSPVALVDLFPTLVELCDLSIGAPSLDALDGQSLLIPYFEETPSEPRKIYSEILTAKPSKKHKYSIRRNGWKLLYTFEDDLYELYHIDEDSGETEDLSSSETEMFSIMRGFMDGWVEE
jgi:arylsulfatase A-like enzyme